MEIEALAVLGFMALVDTEKCKISGLDRQEIRNVSERNLPGCGS